MFERAPFTRFRWLAFGLVPAVPAALYSLVLHLVPAVPAVVGGETPPAGSPAAGPAAVPGATIKVLSMDQEATGLPDQQDPDRATAQKMLIDPVSRRLILILFKPVPKEDPPATVPPAPPAGPSSPAGQNPTSASASREGAATSPSPAPVREVDRRIILNMGVDPPEVLEIWDQDLTFRRTLRDLNTIQEERDKQEATFLNHLGDMTAAEQKALLEDNHLRRDGKRVVELVRGEARKKVLGHDCEEVKVFENGRKVIDAWVARDFLGAKSFFYLYGRLGAFSREVLDRVAGLEGLPLEAEITVVTAAPVYKISARCVAVKEDEVIPAESFEVPAGYKEMKKESPAVVPCAWCGKPVERKEAKRRMVPGGWIYFCSAKCQEAYAQKHDEELKDQRKKEKEREEKEAKEAKEAAERPEGKKG